MMVHRNTQRRAAAATAAATGAATLLAALTLSAVSAAPQEPTAAVPPPEGSAATVPEAPTASEQGTEPDPETVAPYSSWKTHVGEAEEALALVRMRGPDGAEFTVTGLVARCDGFLLVPYAALERRTDGDEQRGEASPVLVSVGACEGETPARALPAVSVYKPRAGTRHRPPFGLLKVTGPHLRSVPLLSAGLVRAGDALRVVWAEPVPEATSPQPPAAPRTPARSRAASRSFTARAADPPRDPNAPRRNAVEWALDGLKPGEADAAKGAVVAAPEAAGAPADLPPLGAVVVDEATGAAVGVVTGQRDGKALFSSFLYLHELTNETPLVPTREAAKERFALQAAELADAERAGGTAGAKQKAVKSAAEMAWVRGGPVRLTGYLRERYRDRYKTDVACVPGFWADVLPVTNKEYREFARRETSGGAPLKLPWGWKESGEVQAPIRIDVLPVNGVDPEEAELYAAQRGKRLLTPIEHLRASKGAYGPWVQETYADWRNYDLASDRMRADIERVLQLFDDFVNSGVYAGRSGPDSDFSARNQQRRRAAPQAPSQGAPPAAPARMNRNQVAAATLTATEAMNLLRNYSVVLDEYSQRAWYPWQISQVGWRHQDQSDFGIRDVVMNPPELAQPVWGRKPYDAAIKMSPSRRDPYLDTPVVAGHGIGSYYRGGGQGLPPEVGSMIITLRKAKHNIGYGFRCAR